MNYFHVVFYSAYETLAEVRWSQSLNYISFLLLVGYVLCAAVLMKWGRLEVWGRLGLKEGSHHNYGVEGLRGPLAFFVVIAHYLSIQNILINDVFGRLNGEHERLASAAGLAVCYFFTITGYLFWRKFLKNPDASPALLFYGRAARILPAFLALCGISLVLIAVTDPSAFVGNFGDVLWRIVSLFTLGSYDVALSKWVLLDVGPTWTLYWELLFYALLPFLFAFRRVIGPLGFHLGLPLLLAFWEPKHLLIFIWVGTLVADICEWLERSPKKWLAPWLLGSLAPLIFLYSFLRGEFSFSRWYCLETGIVVLALARGSSFWGVLRIRPLQALGRIGYSTYLFHGVTIHASIYLAAPFVDFASLGDRGLLVYFICLLPALVVVPAVTFRYFERPFLDSSAARWLLSRAEMNRSREQ